MAATAHGCRQTQVHDIAKTFSRQISTRSALRQRASSSVAINRNTHRIRVPPVDYRPADRTSHVVTPPFSGHSQEFLHRWLREPLWESTDPGGTMKYFSVVYVSLGIFVNDTMVFEILAARY